MMGDHWGNAWMGFHGLWMGLFWVLLVFGVILFVRFVWRESQGDPAPYKDPLKILEERYARGEIDREELEQKRHDLER